MKKQTDSAIEFKPIQCFSGNGYIALSIYPPGTWFGEETYRVFVGGCGLCTCPTLEDAKIALLKRAIERCDRLIGEAEAQIVHFKNQRDLLRSEGLVDQ